MAKVLRIPLSLEGLEKAAEWLEEYASKQLPKYCRDLISQMCKQGESWAVNLLGHIDTGETLSTIVGYRKGNKGVIVAGGNAVWIEFGTGVIANEGNAPHPKAAEFNMSPWGTYVWSEQKSVPPRPHGGDPDGWYYKGDDGRYHRTYGIPSNRFMYNTAQILRKAYPAMAKEIFDK